MQARVALMHRMKTAHAVISFCLFFFQLASLTGKLRERLKDLESEKKHFIAIEPGLEVRRCLCVHASDVQPHSVH